MRPSMNELRAPHTPILESAVVSDGTPLAPTEMTLPLFTWRLTVLAAASCQPTRKYHCPVAIAPAAVMARPIDAPLDWKHSKTARPASLTSSVYSRTVADSSLVTTFLDTVSEST